MKGISYLHHSVGLELYFHLKSGRPSLVSQNVRGCGKLGDYVICVRCSPDPDADTPASFRRHSRVKIQYRHFRRRKAWSLAPMGAKERANCKMRALLLLPPRVAEWINIRPLFTSIQCCSDYYDLRLQHLTFYDSPHPSLGT